MKRKLTCTNYFIIMGKKSFKRKHQNPNANVRAGPDVTFHINIVKYANTLSCKRVSWESGGGDNEVLKLFFYFLYV